MIKHGQLATEVLIGGTHALRLIPRDLRLLAVGQPHAYSQDR